MDVDTRLLRYFAAVAAEGNLTRAAERLFVSQPALTKQIKQLESQLGVRLFTRSRAGMTLTSAGPPNGPSPASALARPASPGRPPTTPTPSSRISSAAAWTTSRHKTSRTKLTSSNSQIQPALGAQAGFQRRRQLLRHPLDVHDAALNEHKMPATRSL
jgi:hypothetical protein